MEEMHDCKRCWKIDRGGDIKSDDGKKYLS